MDIVVLIKQVPATEAVISIAPDEKEIQETDLKWVMNPYDELAVEEALQIQAAQGGTVTIVAVGPERAVDTVRTALAMGADTAVLISDPAIIHGGDYAIGEALAAAISKIPYDLILAGHRTVDTDGWLAPFVVAEKLALSVVSLVTKVTIADGKVICDRTIDGGVATVEASLPVVLTTQRGLNEPRYASLPGIMKAKKKPLETKSLADLGVSLTEKASSERICLKTLPERTAGRIFQGKSVEEMAKELVKGLREETKVI